MKTILFLFGGRSSEYGVSLQSAYGVLTHLDRQRYRPLLVGITREGAADWYACARGHDGPNPFESIYVEAFYREWAERNQIPVQSPTEAEEEAPAA